MLVPGHEVAVLVSALRAHGERVAALTLFATVEDAVAMPRDAGAYAERLYATMWELDGASDVVVVEEPPEGDAWEAVRDRLRRAAS